MDGTNRIKFYSKHDFAAVYHLERIPGVLDKESSQLDFNDINQIIELENIRKFIDSGLFLIAWNESQIERYQSICKNEIPKIVALFFKQITDENMISIHNHVIRKYHEDFWNLYSRFNLQNTISDNVFAEVLKADNTQVFQILRHKKIVKAYGRIISTYLLNHPDHAELIMKENLERREEEKKVYFPDELTPADRVKIIADYIELPDANPNYVELVSKSGSSKELPIDDRLKLRARVIHSKWVKDNIDFSSGIKFGASVSFVDSDEPIDYTVKGLTIDFKYGTKWLKDNMDCPTLLNNLIHLIGLVDERFRCILVSQPNRMSVLEQLMGVKGKDEYNSGSDFLISDTISSAQIESYTLFLKSQGVQMEALFKWFFECYLPLEFRTAGFTYDIPSKDSTTIERCRTLAISMDSILKQFRMYCQDGTIDRELFEMSSEHVFFDRIPSMHPIKYIYAKSEDIKQEIFLCYSDQSMLTYNKKTKGEYSNVPEMLSNNTITMDDFHQYQKPNIEYLIQRGLITNNGSGNMEINVKRAAIIKELFDNEVICYSYCPLEVRYLIDLLVDSEDLEIGNTLFSRPEQDYLNYMLNKSEYSNGLDIRNKYIHGTNSRLENDINHDYIELLKISAVIVIKINEEFCLRFPLSAREK